MSAISVPTGGGNFCVPLRSAISEMANASATLRIACALRTDASFMLELKSLGIYDDDAASVIDDEEDIEE